MVRLLTCSPRSGRTLTYVGKFTREDVREIGHWLRLGKLEERLEGGTAGAQGRRRAAPDQHTLEGGAVPDETTLYRPLTR